MERNGERLTPAPVGHTWAAPPRSCAARWIAGAALLPAAIYHLFFGR
jgi:hypothetical protein